MGQVGVDDLAAGGVDQHQVALALQPAPGLVVESGPIFGGECRRVRERLQDGDLAVDVTLEGGPQRIEHLQNAPLELRALQRHRAPQEGADQQQQRHGDDQGKVDKMDRRRMRSPRTLGRDHGEAGRAEASALSRAARSSTAAKGLVRSGRSL